MQTRASLSDIFDEVEYIIYSAGKTGSITLYESFKRYGKAIHLHSSEQIASSPLYNGLYSWGKGFSIGDVIDYNYKKYGKKLLIVSSYRDPISRKISSFFHNIGYHLKMTEAQILKLPIKELITKFIELLPHLENYHPFCEEKKNLGGIEIFSEPFDKVKGYKLYQGTRADMIVVRFDRLPRIAEAARMKGLNDFKLLPFNLSEGKWYRDIYFDFKEELVIPSKILDYIFELEEEVLHYFLTDSEIENLKKKWYKDSLPFTKQILPEWNWEHFLKNNSEIDRYLSKNFMRTEYYARLYYLRSLGY